MDTQWNRRVIDHQDHTQDTTSIRVFNIGQTSTLDMLHITSHKM